jgi:mRNA deadenylase 3'-5' endonuclease subunit Ccr4
MALTLISINIEGDRNFPHIFPFLEEQKPDVVCLQEIFEEDLVLFKERLGMDGIFVPMTQRPRGCLRGGDLQGDPMPWGLAIVTTMPIISNDGVCYSGPTGPVPLFELGNIATYRRVLAHITIEKEGKRFSFLNTHFTWTPDGKPSEAQRSDIQALLSLLSKQEDFILCGDFNAPRGGEIFQLLADRYIDNIPAYVTTTIDKDLHRSGDLQLVVDGLFSTPHYVVSATVSCGVSDHCAITATIERG